MRQNREKAARLHLPWPCAILHPMNINPDHLGAALRQIGVIVAATGLISGVFNAAQAFSGVAITATGLALILAGSLEN